MEWSWQARRDGGGGVVIDVRLRVSCHGSVVASNAKMLPYSPCVSSKNGWWYWFRAPRESWLMSMEICIVVVNPSFPLLARARWKERAEERRGGQLGVVMAESNRVQILKK